MCSLINPVDSEVYMSNDKEQVMSIRKIKIRGVKVRTKQMTDNVRITSDMIWELRNEYDGVLKGPYHRTTQAGDLVSDHPLRIYYKILSPWFKM